MKNAQKSLISSRLLKLKFFVYLNILIAVVFFFAGCKKEIGSLTNEEVPNAATQRSNSSSEKAPNIVVHAGSSIQSAVDAASPGFLILIEPGVYSEAIVVNKPNIQLVGSSDGVIIQNPGDEENGITVRGDGDGFVLKNVTVKDFEENGVFMIHVDNFLLSHVTTIDNGEYGLFPLFCNNGVIEHCTASGHTDTGIYVGQSTNVGLNFNTAFANVNGIEVENCSHVTVSKNQSYNNVVGILVILLPGLTVKESSDILIDHNHVYNNNHVNFAEPGGGFEGFVPSGSGILIVGTDQTN
ncbi:MAG: right-handed parallel beta-helix repeat-containing protein, partial [Bacteroidota bacterium]|nr:right-handed parallel beta-helix repeat-containing protein [Bacteroidota bacterium]